MFAALFRRCVLLVAFLSISGMAASVHGQNAEESFAPAFDWAAVDTDASCMRQDGESTPMDAAILKKTIGLTPVTGDWQKDRLVLGQNPPAKPQKSTYEMMLVLKNPVAVGTVAMTPPEGTGNGSVTGGELFYLKGDVAKADPDKAEQWVPVEFSEVQPYVQMAVLPAGVKTRAFLYRDVRTDNQPVLEHFFFYKNRLLNVTPLAEAFSEGGVFGSGADTLVEGKLWQNYWPDEGRAPRAAISKDAPSWIVLSWEKAQKLDGIFLRSNATKFVIQTYVGEGTGNPAVMPAKSWKTLTDFRDFKTVHQGRNGSHETHWISFPQVETRAIRIEVTAVSGKTLWIHGVGAMVDLKDGVPPSLVRDNAPPFRFTPEIPLDGEAAFVVEDAKGKRIRNLVANYPVTKGAGSIPWDLRDEAGKFVAPGAYQLKGVVAPPLELTYKLTTYPNIQNFFPDRAPWLTSHGGPHGWLADHGPNWACATGGDRVYFGATMAEAGVALIECDLDGKKQWGRHDFGAWTGVNLMGASSEALFVHAADKKIHRMEAQTRQSKMLTTYGSAFRRGTLISMAADKTNLYLAFGGEPLFDNPAPANSIDLNGCFPRPAGGMEPWNNYIGVLRMGSHPPGDGADPTSKQPQGTGKVYLESTHGTGADQHVVVGFHQAIPLGSLVFPAPEKAKLKLSVLKPDAPYPPRPNEEGDWLTIDKPVAGRWQCIAAPENTMTRAVRVTFQSDRDLLDEEKWFDRLEGLRMLNRRFRDLSPAAKIRVNSGTVSANGEWDAKRTEPIEPENPGIYVMEWDKPQQMDGLAIKEIDGAVTEIDAWTGDGPVTLDGAGWTQVATYQQKRRVAQYKENDNYQARYMDGYVEFRPNGVAGSVTTKALRLRVVQQWLDNANGGVRRMDGKVEHGVHYSQSAMSKLDARWCRILGVSVLQALGGEPKMEMVYKRLEVRDALTGKLRTEYPLALGWFGLCSTPTGGLYSIGEKHRSIVKIDPETGAATTVLDNTPVSRMAVGPDGSMYVLPGDKKPIAAYDASGKMVRTIGHGGAHEVGPWDPQRFGNVINMCVDQKNSLWVVESDMLPRRILQYNTQTGELVKEILGNCNYGGAGTISSVYPNRAYLGNLEFEIDWKNNSSKLRAKLAESLYGDVVDRRVGDRVYLATVPLSLDDAAGLAAISLKDDEACKARTVAAFGNAGSFPPLKAAGLLATLPGAPKEFRFIWTDRNGDGAPSKDEVIFEKRGPEERPEAIGHVDAGLGYTSHGASYTVKEFLANGAPVYERKPLPPALKNASFKLNNGNFVALHATTQENGRSETTGFDAAGNALWAYPSGSPGVSGLYIPSWKRGEVSNEFGIVGHATSAGDLGEFFVVHSNTGAWRIWSADGFLAGMITLHKGDPRARFLSFPSAPFGMRVDPITLSQEHFHGFFTKNSVDNKYYAMMGFNHLSVMEVGGIDQIRRVSARATVTPQSILEMADWEARRASRQIESRGLLIKAQDTIEPPTLDGMLRKNEWGKPAAAIGEKQDISFYASYDASTLYVAWSGKGQRAIKNSGGEFQRLFKTGGAVDLMIATDPDADPTRRRPAKGDMRLLITSVKDKPVAVLYQAVYPGAKPEDGWKTYTEAAGETKFDRVVELKNVEVAISSADGFTVEAAIPLKTLGLTPKPGMRVKFDWGVLTTGDGTQVKDRMYWANTRATGTSDEAVEARLEPHLWGYLAF